MKSRAKRTNRKRVPLAFQRLLIVHQSLVVACTGRDLDEGASPEEQSEHILFYYNRNRSDTDDGDVEDQDSLANTLEAIQCAGLCSAVYSLPTNVASSHEKYDRARHAHFGRSTLVFVSIEPDILVIVQMPRPSAGDNGRTIYSGDGNPLAVQSSIQGCHEMFCLLRGGGIQHRLSIHNRESCTESHLDEQLELGGANYPGMSTLFALRERKRSLLKTLEREIESDAKESAEAEIEKLSKEIKALLRTLPIKSLREDLFIHYNEYLSEMDALASSGVVSNCCIVNHVPMPGGNPESSLHLEQNHVEFTETAELLNQCLEQLLCRVADRHCTPVLAGVSCFFHGEFVSTHAPFCSVSSERDTSKNPSFRILVEPQHAKMVYAYMLSFRTRARRNSATAGSTYSPTSSPLRKIPISSSHNDGTEVEEKGMGSYAGGYLEPPPLCMLSASDQIFEVGLPYLGESVRTAWTPRVHLPFESSAANDVCTYGVTETQVALYEGDCYSFLLFLKYDELSDQESSEENLPTSQGQKGRVGHDRYQLSSVTSASELLKLTSEYISSTAMKRSFPHSPPFNRLPEWYEPGQDIIFIDRREQKLTLVTGRETSQEAKTGKISINIFGVKRGSWKSDGTSQMKNFSLNKTDCRHTLATFLPLRVIHAFDDAMTSIYDLSYSKGQSAFNYDGGSPQGPPKIQDGALEICTLLPGHGWIYAHVHDELETYVLFDSAEYVTIADVQSAVVHMHRNLLHGRI